MVVSRLGRRLVTGILVALASTAHAGPLAEIAMVGQPLQYTEAGKVNGCGIRVVGTTTPLAGVPDVHVVDASFNLFLPATGMVKGGLRTTAVAKFLRGEGLANAKPVAITAIWFKAPGREITKPLTGPQLGSPVDKGALMYATAPAQVLELVQAVQNKETIQVGFAVKQRGLDQTYFGRVELSESELVQMAQCFGDLYEQVPTK